MMETNKKSVLRNVFSKKVIILIFLFFAFLFYALFLLQGLSFYMYGYDDFQLIYDVLPLSFAKILSAVFLNPLNLYQGFLHQGIYQRTVHGIFLKISYMLGDLNPFFYHTVRAIFFALTGIVVYLFTKQITKNEAVSIAAGFLYCSLPVIYDGLRHTGAAEPFSQFFLVLALYLFVKFYNAEESDKGKRKYLYPLIIFFLGLFAIKSRETEILIIPVIGSFLLLNYKDWRKNKWWFVTVFLLSLYLVPAIFTQFNVVEDAEHKTIAITSEKVLTNIHNLLLYNPMTRTGNGEQVPVIFSLKQYISETPGSLLGSIGFFIAWYFIAMLGVYSYSLWKDKNKGEAIQNNESNIPSSNYFTIALLWFIFSILLMIPYVNPGDHSDIRYIGVMALPAILVIIPFCYFMTEYIKKLNIKYVSKYILVIFLIVLFLSIVINAGITSVYRRGGIGSRHKGMEQSAITIFEDLYNQSFDNSYFFAMTEISGEGKYINCIFSTNISLTNVTVTDDPFLSFTRPITDANINASLLEYGVVYVVSYAEPLMMNTYPDMQLIKEINPCEVGYYCRVKEFIKRQSISPSFIKKQLSKEPRYFVYRIGQNNISFEKQVRMLCSGKEGLPENVI